MSGAADDIRRQIAALVEEYYRAKHGTPPHFVPGKTPVRYAGRVFDHHELQGAVDASLDFWLTAGRYCDELESLFSELTGVEYAMLTNSGSSANLLALSALTSPLHGGRSLRPGDEVIAVAAGFPTTLNPILQNGLVPVFVDVDIGTYNAIPEQVEEALGPRTRAVFLAHTLGNPFDLARIGALARERGLWLIEDCCDALGSSYGGRSVGTFGDVATCSFYPAHHITTGEGGMVFTADMTIARAVRSFRDWGRDCYCAGGETNTCGRRFSGKYGNLPQGYDHKYVYSHIGYNLKMTEMQAAIGVAQMAKLPEFVRRRRENFDLWTRGFAAWEDRFILPRATPGADPAWFAYPVTVRAGAGFSRNELTSYLESRLIETRALFAGNLLNHPAYLEIPRRVHGTLANTDVVMSSTFFLGTYPGMTRPMVDYTLSAIAEFIREH